MTGKLRRDAVQRAQCVHRQVPLEGIERLGAVPEQKLPQPHKITIGRFQQTSAQNGVGPITCAGVADRRFVKAPGNISGQFAAVFKIHQWNEHRQAPYPRELPHDLQHGVLGVGTQQLPRARRILHGKPQQHRGPVAIPYRHAGGHQHLVHQSAVETHADEGARLRPGGIRAVADFLHITLGIPNGTLHGRIAQMALFAGDLENDGSQTLAIGADALRIALALHGNFLFIEPLHQQGMGRNAAEQPRQEDANEQKRGSGKEFFHGRHDT